MKRKLQVILTEETWEQINAMVKEANTGFMNGHITCSDVVNEMILCAKIDIRALQTKHTNVRKSLRLIAAQKEIDIDSAIKSLMELKARGIKKSSRNQTPPEQEDN